MERGRMSGNFGGESNDSNAEKRPGFFERVFGKKVLRAESGDWESAGNDGAEGSDLNSVVSKMEQLSNDATKRTPEIFAQLVGAAVLPNEVKIQLINSYRAGDDFSTLVEALSKQEVEAKEAKRERLIGKLKTGMKATVAIGVATAVLAGAATMLHYGLTHVNDGVSAATETPIVETVETSVDEVATDAGEDEMEISILDDETLYSNSNYENFDIDEIGKASVERYLDTGEGYEMSENGIAANFSDYNDFEDKSSHNAFGTEISDEALEALVGGDRDQYVDEVMTKYVNNPAIAAAHVSLVDPAMDYLGVPDDIQDITGYGERAQAVWDWVREQGGDKNDEVMGVMYVNLKADTTQFQVNERSGTDWTMYETVNDSGEPMSIENALLMGQSRIERDDAVQVKTTLHFINSEGDEIEVTFVDNTDCGGQPTGPVITRNKTTDIVTIDIPTDDEQEQEQEETEEQTTTEDIRENRKTNNDTDQKETEESESTESTSTQEVPEDTTSETPEPGSEVEDSSEETTEAIKSKDAESLVQGVDQALTDAGSNNVVTQTPVIDTSTSTSTPSTSTPENGDDSTVVSTVTSNDGTTANINSSNQVVSVTDGKTGDTVTVESGNQTPTYNVTEKEPEEVAVAVDEGKTYDDSNNNNNNNNDNNSNSDSGNGGDEQKSQEQRENEEADQLMELLNS